MKGIEEIVQAQHRVLMIILAPQSSVPADMTTNLPNVCFGPKADIFDQCQRLGVAAKALLQSRLQRLPL
jgi:hypothetical protein